MLGSKFVKFLMSILKWQVSSSSNFATFAIAMTDNSPGYIFNFRQKYTIKVPIWRLSRAPVKICQTPHVSFWKHKPVFFRSLYQSWVQLNITRFLAQTVYNLVKSRPWKCKFLRLSSSGVKIHQIPYVNFEMTSQFLFRGFIILQCHYL